MSKRKWVYIKILGPEINAMREAGKTQQEIAEHFGLDKIQIKNWINRYNKEVKRIEAVISPLFAHQGSAVRKPIQRISVYQRSSKGTVRRNGAFSACQRCLAEFAPAGAKEKEIIFSGSVYVGENTSPLAAPLSNESPVNRLSRTCQKHPFDKLTSRRLVF